MRTLAALLCITIVVAGLVPLPLTGAEAAKPTDTLVVPLTGTTGGGGTFRGSFSITSFEARGKDIYAVGIVSGVVTGDSAGARSGISGPFESLVQVTNQSARAPGAVVAQQAGCEIHLSFLGL